MDDRNTNYQVNKKKLQVKKKSETEMSRLQHTSIVTINTYLQIKKTIFIQPTLEINLFLKIDLPKLDRHTRGNWLIHSPKHTKHHKDN